MKQPLDEPSSVGARSNGNGRVIEFAAFGKRLALGVGVGLFVVICLAIKPRTYARGLLALVPVRRRERGRQVLVQVQETLASWLLPKTATMAVVGVITGLGLWILGVQAVETYGITPLIERKAVALPPALTAVI